MPMGRMYKAPRPKRTTKKKREANLNKKIAKAVQRGVTSYAGLRSRSLIPKKSVLYFPYTALITLDTPNAFASEDFTQVQYRLNDIFDVDTSTLGLNNITATGFQHVFGTAVNGYQDGIYQEFTVLSTDVEVTFLNEERIGGICALYCNQVSGADLDYRTMTNQPKWYKERIYTPGFGAGSKQTIRMKWDAARFVGSDVRDLSEYRGSNNSSPANTVYLYVLARNMNLEETVNSLQVRVKLRFKVECTIPRDLEKGI